MQEKAVDHSFFRRSMTVYRIFTEFNNPKRRKSGEPPDYGLRIVEKNPHPGWAPFGRLLVFMPMIRENLPIGST